MSSPVAAAILAFSVAVPGAAVGAFSGGGQGYSTVVSPVNSGSQGNPMLNITEPMVSYDVRSASLREVEPEDNEGAVETGLYEMVLGIDALNETDVEIGSLAVLTSDMLEPIMDTPGSLVLHRWMIVEREDGSVDEAQETESEEEESGDYSWVWSADVLAYGDVVSDMLAEENNGYTVSIDFGEHLSSDVGDELREPGEYSLVLTSDVFELGHVFGIVDFKLEAEGEGFEMLSFFSPDSVDASTVAYDVIESEEDEEYWTDERMDDAEPAPMLTDEAQQPVEGGWTGVAGVLTVVALGALFAALVWAQKFIYRGVKHVEEKD